MCTHIYDSNQPVLVQSWSWSSLLSDEKFRFFFFFLFATSFKWRWVTDCNTHLSILFCCFTIIITITTVGQIKRYYYWTFKQRYLYGSHQANKCHRTCANCADSEHPAHVQSIIQVLFSIHTVRSIQLCQWSVYNLLRRSGPSLSAHFRLTHLRLVGLNYDSIIHPRNICQRSAILSCEHLFKKLKKQLELKIYFLRLHVIVNHSNYFLCLSSKKSFLLKENITKTCLFKYTENLPPKNENFQIKNSDILHVSA